DVAWRAAKERCDQGYGVGETKLAVYLDFRDVMKRDGEQTIREKYGNLLQMYEKITGEDPYRAPMRIFPAVHYAMGGLWVDYNLESTIPGLFVLGEANFSDHGANRLGASALMQGLADGYFILPYTVGNHLATKRLGKVGADNPAFDAVEADARGRIEKMISIRGGRTVDSIHRELGRVMWEYCGMSRTASGLNEVIAKIRGIRDLFWRDVRVSGTNGSFNQNLEHAGRLADFLEFAELLAIDALHRNESCGGHFREEYQTPENEALRDDENFAYVAAWEFNGVGQQPKLHKEPLVFEAVSPATRSYK
ncbi:MAG: FAD-binding protein, partial [Planctomycetaceae bacterium]